MKFGATAGDPYWDKDKACGKALFLFINIRCQSQAPPSQALVTSGVLWADVADPSGLLIAYVFIQISARTEKQACPYLESFQILMTHLSIFSIISKILAIFHLNRQA